MIDKIVLFGSCEAKKINYLMIGTCYHISMQKG